MALLVAWLSLGVCGLLSAVCFLLYSDRKGQQKALAALQSEVAALSRDVAALAGPAALRMETAPEVAARLRRHCGRPPCRSFDCRCTCTGCVEGRGELSASPRR
jgi:hypothetical protein